MEKCRICSSVIGRSHCISLFSEESVKSNLASRMAKLLEVPISQDDNLSNLVCRSCKGRYLTVENKLESMRTLAKSSYQICYPTDQQPSSRKRTKDTSGDGASPSTMKARPASKRGVGRSKTLFPCNSSNQPPKLVVCTPIQAPDCLVDITNRQPSTSVPQQKVVTCTCIPEKHFVIDVSKEPSHATSGIEPSNAQQRSVQISISSPSRSLPCTKEVDSDLQKVARALAGGCTSSVARAVFAHSALREQVLLKVLDLVDSECAVLCRKTGPNGPSPFRRLPVEKMEEFSWDKYTQELKLKGPFLFRLFSTLVNHNDHRNKTKRGSTHTPGICMSIAALLKERNREMTGVQTYVSLVLFNHVQKQVFTRLNHLNITLSYKAVLQVVSEIGDRHLIPLQRWLASGECVQFIGDNVDKRKSVRDIRSDNQAKLHHMYSMVAVKARVPPPTVDRFTPVDLEQVPISTFLPSVTDIQSLRRNSTILVCRILCKYIKSLACMSDVIPQHIIHAHTIDMDEKSETIVLDVLHKNEAKHEDMLDIMRTQQSYLEPYLNETRLSGGDQLTIERQRCAKRHIMDSDTPKERLDYLEPKIEDWHALQTFLMVIWKNLFLNKTRDHGTLCHLFSVTGRLPKAKKPKAEFSVCLDSLMAVFSGYVVAAACQELEIDDPDSKITQLNGMSKDERLSFMIDIANKVVDKCGIVTDALLNKKVADTKDGVYNYSRVLCHYAALCLEFKNAWENGDGKRIMRCWRVFLLHFRESGRTKYALEALTLQFQLATLRPSLVHQLTWGRFINTHGGRGRNIPCDLYNEHVNRLFKDAVQRMGANFTEKATTRVARSITFLEKLCSDFDSNSGISPPPTAHTTKDDKKDVHQIASIVKTNKLLDIITGRYHSNFRKISNNPLNRLDWDKTKEWIKSKVVAQKKYQPLSEGDISNEDAVSESDSSDND